MPGKRKIANCPLKSIWDESLVEEVLTNKKHRNKIWNWLIHHSCNSLSEIPFREFNIPMAAEQKIINEFVLFTTVITQKKVSVRGDTTKLLVKLQDGYEVETVVMKHMNHATVCISSQIGCQMGCRFCATGTMGIIGDLTAGEILEQLAHANRVTKIRNVVFMGMGEPLQNYENVRRAVLFMVDDQRYGLAARQVTVSTVGVLKNMKRLSDEIPHVNLALSLHAPIQSIRLKIVPTASAAPIDKLMEAVDYHISNHLNHSRIRKQEYLNMMSLNHEGSAERSMSSNDNSNELTFTKRNRMCCVMIEYILIKDVNDRPENAHDLSKLLLPRRDHVLLNLIPYNPTDVAEDYFPPTDADVKEFSRICQSDPYFIHTRIRQEMGQDINGACGQLVLSKKSKTEVAVRDIEDQILFSSVSKSSKQVNTSHSIRTGLCIRLTLAHLVLPMIAVLVRYRNSS